MKKRYLSEEKMLPVIHMVRRFSAEKGDGSESKPIRTVKGYETGIYLTDGGSITINGVSHELRRYNIRFLREGDKVSSRPSYTCNSIYFEFGDDGSFYENEMLKGIPSFFMGNEGHAFLFQRIAQYASGKEAGCGAAVNGLVLQLLANYYQLTHLKENYSEVVASCMNYMKEHLGEHITLEDLGRFTGYSSLHVLRLFKADTGQTPHVYLTRLRIAHAKELLTDGNAPMTAIAAACGFESESHFQSLFKRETGIAPGKYRKYAEELN